MDGTQRGFEELWRDLDRESRAYEQSVDRLRRKRTGLYLTSLDLALAMMEELVGSLEGSQRRKLYEKRFLEPCAGTGNFVFAYLRVCRSLGFTQEQYRRLLDNIYACDVNGGALAVYRRNLERAARAWFGVALDEAYFAAHTGGGLLYDLDGEPVRYIPVEEALGPAAEGGFDIVVTNPPYKNLKAESSHYATADQQRRDKRSYAAVGGQAAARFPYAACGVLNLYKLFVEEICDRYLAPGGWCSLLLASSILSDKSCARLRTHLLETCSIRSLRLIAESSRYIDASQALCAMLFRKGERTERVFIDGSFAGDLKKGALADIEDVLDQSTGNALLVLTGGEYRIRRQMKAHPTIGQIPYIRNLRGELDLTEQKGAISARPTAYPLLRGRHIGYYRLMDRPEEEYVREDFVRTAAKRPYIFRPRLACQQIANMAKKRRVCFAYVPEGHVLANSCNFIALEDNPDGVDLYFLMGVLNSSLIDWYFRLTSSNNHINNYELDGFPIPLGYSRKEELSAAVRSYLDRPEEALLGKIDAMVYEAYGIAGEDRPGPGPAEGGEDLAGAFCRDLGHIVPGVTEEECRRVLAGVGSARELGLAGKPDATAFEKRVMEGMEKKYRALQAGQVLNHTTFKLSALDMEMIRPIPQGGSWRDIPPETVQKSRRLMRITQTGGRTTLYGRIDYARPSYTITTYFNRPGNGTYVHPVHDRVLSVREAARLQTFPDSYLFCGNKSDMLRQVGNAFPVLLAYRLGRTILEKTGCRTSVDLFSGAGGMTHGFWQAGIRAAVANDIDESACVTLAVNNPEIKVLWGDVTDGRVRERIIRQGQAAGADIICGGPPCQGFSLAGFRKKDDPRNELFRHFVDIVSAVRPKVIVFENVEGLLSFQNGRTYRDIITLFSQLGYRTEGRKLLASDYGVPQRRRRVVIICTRRDMDILPGALYPEPVTPEEDRQVTAYEALRDLEQVPCGEDARYEGEYTSPLLRCLKGRVSMEAYFRSLMGRPPEK